VPCQDWTREHERSPPAICRSVLRHSFAAEHGRCSPTHAGRLNATALPQAPLSPWSFQLICAEAPPIGFQHHSSAKTNSQKGPSQTASRYSRHCGNFGLSNLPIARIGPPPVLRFLLRSKNCLSAEEGGTHLTSAVLADEGNTGGMLVRALLISSRQVLSHYYKVDVRVTCPPGLTDCGSSSSCSWIISPRLRRRATIAV
jgi:hypothetical protein